MDRLTSSRTSASVLLFVLLVKQGACVQPECDPLEFYKIYSPVIFSLKFRVTGELNTPHILQQDCNDLKNVTERVETLLQGCTADKDEDLKKHIRGLQLTRDSLCGGELVVDLILWKYCFDATVFDVCKKNVDERLNKLKQDGALDATGDHTCRNRSLSLQCALQAGAGCPKNAERARKAVENYINTRMDTSGCRRPTEYACEDDLFRNCYWSVAYPGGWELPMFPSGAEKLAEGCKVAKSVRTCTRNVQIERCPEEKKKYLYTLKDRFWSIRDSLCNEQLPAGVEVWNKCLNQKALKNCNSKIPEPKNFDTEADGHADLCRQLIGSERETCFTGSSMVWSKSLTLYHLRRQNQDAEQTAEDLWFGYSTPLR